jgi:hypothetical protein
MNGRRDGKISISRDCRCKDDGGMKPVGRVASRQEDNRRFSVPCLWRRGFGIRMAAAAQTVNVNIAADGRLNRPIFPAERIIMRNLQTSTAKCLVALQKQKQYSSKPAGSDTSYRRETLASAMRVLGFITYFGLRSATHI